MNKRITYILVNCTRVFEGTLRNLLTSSAAVISMTTEQLLSSLFHVNKSSDEESPKSEEYPAAASQDFVNAVEPECIIYQISENEKADAEAVGQIRRKCAFRDVLILIATAYKDVHRAERLFLHGADKALLIPMQPELLLKRLSEVIKPAGRRMPVVTKIINPYISATIDLLSTMAHLHAVKKEVFLKKNYRVFGDVSAIMPFTGKAEGEVVVCFHEDLARQIVSRIMNTQPALLNITELREGIGEIVNIIAGNAKAALSTTEYAHQITLPAIVFGQNHEISHPGDAPCIVVIFEVDTQPMAVLVSMAVK
jgi:chemotaxis protein CheX